MGTNNLFRKRRGKGPRDLRRHKPYRKPYAKVLVVCEGENTEPHYFNGLINHYGLSSAAVKVCGGECGSDPFSIFRHAQKRYRDERGSGDPFDRVYCVFDKDAHGTYKKALDSIKRARPKDKFFATNSVPCFEYWLLLHFQFTTKPYEALPGNSACNQVLTVLKTHMPRYSKGDSDSFLVLEEKLDAALKNANRALRDARNQKTDNPTTRVHELVEYLRTQIRERS